MKTCSNPQCQQTNPQPLDNFGKRAEARDGRLSRCKSCRAASSKTYRDADPERARAAVRASAAKRPDRERQRYLDDPQAAKDRAHRRRALQVGALFGEVDVKPARDCYLCGRPLSGTVDVDHVVPLSRGGAHSTENLRLTHERCNLRKYATALADLDWYSGSILLGAWTVRPVTCAR